MKYVVNSSTAGLKKIERRLSPANIRGALVAGGKRGGDVARRRLDSRNIRDRVTSGRLAKSINVLVLADTAVSLGTNLKYARVQNEGHPNLRSSRPNGLLAIPATPQLKRAGVWPRDVAGLKFIPLKGKGALKGMLVYEGTAGQNEDRNLRRVESQELKRRTLARHKKTKAIRTKLKRLRRGKA